MATVTRITPCLWFDSEAEDAAKLYTSVFPNSKIGVISRYTEAGREFHGKEPGSVLTVEFTLDGQSFTALNGGPMFKLSEAVSFQISCADQAEIDHYWDKLSHGGEIQQCGWLKDKFGLSWQVVPAKMAEWMSDPARAQRVMAAVFPMKKLDMAALERAAAG
jgi:predicted 3-demethylubiquinone-9 3-methyltransferase (glyoxalase superfamily)